jgi:hypothetical protein
MTRTVPVMIDGVEHQKEHDDACPVCVHPLGFRSEGLIARGQSYAKVSEFTRESGERVLTPSQLRAHLPHMVAFQRIEREALDAASGSLNDERGSLVTPAQLTRLALQKAYERLADGAEVQVRDITALLRLEQQAQGGESDARATSLQWESAVRELMWIVHRHLRGSAWGAFIADVKNSETLNALMPQSPEGEKSSPAEGNASGSPAGA